MTKLRQQIVIIEQPTIRENQQVEEAALFSPDGTPFTGGSEGPQGPQGPPGPPVSDPLELPSSGQVRTTLSGEGNTIGLTLTDADGVDRATIHDDGSGLTLTDTDGNPLIILSETGLEMYAGVSDAKTLLDFENAFQMFDYTGVFRVLLGPVDGLFLKDSGGVDQMSLQTLLLVCLVLRLSFSKRVTRPT